MASKYRGDSLIPHMEQVGVTPKDWKPSHISEFDPSLQGRQSFEENIPPTEKRGWSSVQRYQNELKRYSQPPTTEAINVAKIIAEEEMDIIRPSEIGFFDSNSYERKW
ncbi:MAG: hypothetical protein COU29_01645 [Candidatus Magasanikbacteria bacterium CG10_big_fil_rev_8_21_14_0_10_36_32]|uniref:Uncharacterized protein n=1 Tax=Candidatus Magasanikbacteria bacterium CG10_big_fil_rev_8_21_14_0_10_36_32 TaxID=1974646 RepID=A0A2M6W6T0_9BACT|nr:MAG: hypothetical protein COU29_01645 [Candidatus Magasanikbacteria bacterium CG10_big_fil_rev_8_21_14_0_10_36_32]